MTTGERLKQCRELMRFSQERVALHMDKAGRATISNWENDKNEPSLTELKRLAAFLNTTVAYLMGEAPQFQEPRENYVMVKKDDLIELQKKALEHEAEKNKELLEKLEVEKTKKPEE
ncbi:helix-turn-helix domain-containing protein [Dyadobacter pollutisoli]|uniref:Helix-turn-helix transcriptional regulator n=1 Tax=Dyadobacter pollutisoli TaxID=2910158 RepID=A0A9E8NCX8_9BACT|nr:helix-turn-helix transcriptional regulator [Dyadobacter pollutisoli]WAC14395.1 helix-turn-helix transcriptional regulator [Dyadobacter pollutisoli]